MTSPRSPSTSSRAKDKSDSFRLMGFGHRIYKNMDPRRASFARLLRSAGRARSARRSAVQDRAGARTHRAGRRLLHRQEALSQCRFLFRQSSSRAMGIPSSHVSPRSSPWPVPRAGWRQWNEMLSDPAHKIGRPRQLYTGAARRSMSLWISAEPGARFNPTGPCP